MELAGFIPLGGFSWLVPEHRWPSLAYLITTAARLQRTLSGDVRRSLEHLLTEAWDEQQLSRFANLVSAHKLELRLQYLRCYRPGGWHPKVELHGEDNLRSAISGGKGTVLWVSHFVYHGLITKLALAKRGYTLIHMSRPEHGFSKTRFGMRVLNPVRAHIEDRYLSQRVIYTSANSVRAMRTLREKLLDNGIVSITVGAWEGKRFTEHTFRGVKIRLATGAPALALATGAKLLPVFTLRDDHSGVFHVTVGEPIECTQAAAKNFVLATATKQYLEALLPFIRRCPDQWRGWKYLTVENTP